MKNIRFKQTAEPVPSTLIEPTQPTAAEIGALETLFRNVADSKMEIGWSELKQILDQSMGDEMGNSYGNGNNMPSNGNDDNNEHESSGGIFAMLCGNFCQKHVTTDANMNTSNKALAPITSQLIENQGFSKDICRSMVAMLDVDHSGRLGIDEFKKLMIDIYKWRAIFKSFDHDGSGKFNTFELRAALEASGYKLSNHVLNALVHRYSSRDGLIAFDDFIMCAVKIKTMIDLFEERDVDKTNTATFSLDDWMTKTLYS